MKKYGLENFSLGILKFCKNDYKVCLNLEQKWLDKSKPCLHNKKKYSFFYKPSATCPTLSAAYAAEGQSAGIYNVLNVVGNSCFVGTCFKHSFDTIIELKPKLNKENLPAS